MKRVCRERFGMLKRVVPRSNLVPFLWGEVFVWKNNVKGGA
ncbi:hypothetical protein BSM4216_2825 [Bacillus smithii]|nr:hypothetical protein BSM4216_2825 [Bacillus smithii]